MKHKNWMKKIFTLSIIACLLLTVLPVSFQADNTDAGPKAGKVDEASIPADAIHISTTHDLISLAENCVDETYSQGKVFVLDQDINMSGVEFSGIPTFAGTFLGQGHQIYGLKFENANTVSGFFRYLQKGAVVNGLILHIDIQADSKSMIGAIAGVNKGTIRNCIVNGVVSGKEMVGGITGWNRVSGTVENCTVNGVVYGTYTVGGFVGKNQGVIRECLNLAEVNTAVEHNTIGLDIENINMDIEISLDMDMSSFGFSESMDSACDIGGIAGTSSGVIRACVNKGAVGYEKMSTNVGGIVGSSNGYLVDCVNYAEINGSKGVGGIAGQLMPNIVVNFDDIEIENPLDSLDDFELELSEDDIQSIKDMMDEADKLENSEGDAESETPEVEIPEVEIPEIEIPDSEGTEPEESDEIQLPESFDDIELPEDLENFEDLETEEFDEDKFNAALNELSNSLKDSVDDTDFDIESELGERTDMTLSLGDMDLGLSLGMDIVDVSREDTDKDTVAKTYQCVNYGTIYGVKYTGGIAGNANSSATSDMEDGVSVDEEMSISGECEQRLVIRECTNYGKVSINNKYAGGIVGYMALGAVINSYNVGNLDCINADYVGGIAGKCNAYIYESISKCIIAGADYVGGIAGYGYECYDSCAFVDIQAGSEYVGSIFGSTETLPDDKAEDEEDNSALVTGNTYYTVGKNIGGIDGINYAGASKSITLEKFLAKDNLPECCKMVSVRFVIEGQDEVVISVPTGGTIGLDQLPVPQVEEGEIYEWIYAKPVTDKVLGMNEVEETLYLSEARLTGILFDQTYEADFNPKHMVAQGTEKTSDGKTRILAIGAFDTTTDVTISNMLSEEATVLGVQVDENWKVEISNIGVKELRYRIPTGMDAEDIVVYVKDADGNWSEREFTVIGSYLAFDFSDGDQGFALQETSNAGVGIILIVVVVAIVIVGVLVVRKGKSKKIVNVNTEE